MNTPERTAVRPPTAALRLKSWQQFTLLGALSMFAPLSTDMYLPALPSLQHDLSASATAVTLTLTSSLIGLGTGQLVAGPLSDAFGRRRPVLAGLVIYTVASVLCALAPDVWTLTAMRLIQGAAGAAGIVIARAVVSDLYSGVAAARYFARLMIVIGLAPILAPLIGGQLLHVTDWRGIFFVLAGIGAALSFVTWRALGETLPPEARGGSGLRTMLSVLRVLVHDRRFMGLTICFAVCFGAVFAYISGSPFVLEDIFGLSPQLFGVLFALNAVGLVAVSQVSGRMVASVGPQRLLTTGVVTIIIAGAGMMVTVLAGGGLAPVEICFFLIIASFGLVAPNATALALAPYPHVAGSASALMGLAQFSLGAAVAPLVGIAGSRSAVPTASVILALVLTGGIVLALSTRQIAGRTVAPVVY
ncbi:MAG TPA: multidrug effflux MFS transporter [Solirubrobacteraceae bacterium]|jgi:DHA1 family bicyclomycin/chloramphenicol resistance-like MFS transporter